MMVLLLVGLVILCVLAYLASQYPASWLASVATVLVVLAIFILGATVLVFVSERLDTLAREYRCVFFILALYVTCFALFEVTAREQRIKRFRLGELKGGDWARRFAKVSDRTEPKVLRSLYEDGIALRNEFGNLTYAGFKKDLAVVASMVEREHQMGEES